MKLWLAFVLLSTIGCGRKESTATPEGHSDLRASAAGPSAAAEPAPSGRAASWFSGDWTGTYKTVAHRIDLPTNRGGIPEWKADDGKAFVGPGTISIDCAEDGTVSGALNGALGEQEIRGMSDDQSLHARIVPKSHPSFTGTLSVLRAESGASGELRASTDDGHVAREGTVTLTRTAR